MRLNKLVEEHVEQRIRQANKARMDAVADKQYMESVKPENVFFEVIISEDGYGEHNVQETTAMGLTNALERANIKWSAQHKFSQNGCIWSIRVVAKLPNSDAPIPREVWMKHSDIDPEWLKWYHERATAAEERRNS